MISSQNKQRKNSNDQIRDHCKVECLSILDQFLLSIQEVSEHSWAGEGEGEGNLESSRKVTDALNFNSQNKQLKNKNKKI